MRQAINMMHTIKQLENKISVDGFFAQVLMDLVHYQVSTPACHISVPLVTALRKEKMHALGVTGSLKN